MDTDPRIDSYEWAGGREAMLRFGPDDGPVAVLALPLFEEANRTRAFGVSILRALAVRGIGGVLPELPGQGDSEVATANLRLADLRAALVAVPGTHHIAIRSGALLVDKLPSWMLTPQDVPSLQRELSRLLSAQEHARHPDHRKLRRVGLSSVIPGQVGDTHELVGNEVPSAFFDELTDDIHPGEGRGPVAMSNEGRTTSPNSSQLGPGIRRGGMRVVRLASDPLAADAYVDGSPPWRRAEPGDDPVLAQTLAADIADWIATCEG